MKQGRQEERVEPLFVSSVHRVSDELVASCTTVMIIPSNSAAVCNRFNWNIVDSNFRINQMAPYTIHVSSLKWFIIYRQQSFPSVAIMSFSILVKNIFCLPSRITIYPIKDTSAFL